MDQTLSATALDRLIIEYGFSEPIHVMRPALPPLEAYTQCLQRIWSDQWLTNTGFYHRELERQLREYMGVEHVNLFCNGTIALMVALQLLRINDGEVITTPFTFPATPHVLHWGRITPAFCDIDPVTLNLDPAKAERLIGPDTRALLPVHVYGTPCDIEGIEALAERHGLPVIYDAAHAFGARYKGKALCSYGDLSVLSFHATKLFSTAEGGALVCNSAAHCERINFLKNFGIANEETVVCPGINGKMNELQAAYGVLQLQMVGEEISRRREVVQEYRKQLGSIAGLRFIPEMPELEPNYAYLPVLVDEVVFGMSRDTLYGLLRRFNVFPRKYFYPLCSRYPCYAALPSANPDNLLVAEGAARQVLCLPLYGQLGLDAVRRIGFILRELAGQCPEYDERKLP